MSVLIERWDDSPEFQMQLHELLFYPRLEPKWRFSPTHKQRQESQNEDTWHGFGLDVFNVLLICISEERDLLDGY